MSESCASLVSRLSAVHKTTKRSIVLRRNNLRRVIARAEYAAIVIGIYVRIAVEFGGLTGGLGRLRTLVLIGLVEVFLNAICDVHLIF
ncbi:hypothetical protein CEY04_13540 [Achromobacter sp. HZ28]|nr:hypothetical protein CEY04_13540 [Achromobacter sp. HZ28]OWT77899.1 hypothetical protein CEY05_08035 [Achromobacter sp. HZ34]